ncbi:Peptide deformylase [Methanocorpusculaceae archaeon Ag1]|uniref:Peptide deformylase n=2 Tax=Methanorbis furvi TaxID=3028299 RepID=A0AAE4MAN1_9EURY|nr:Peptide deformylase [Methanocorpusculaceae archaeon Ag1]
MYRDIQTKYYTMIREIRQYGDPVLFGTAETVPEITPEVRDILTDMWDTMAANRCVGLSAPQIGVSLRLFVINAGGVVIRGANPEVLSVGALVEETEGSPCVPGIQRPVRRPRKIEVRYLDESGVVIECELKGVAARAFLHEKDHHEGKLFIDHLKPVQRKLIQKDLDKIAASQTRTEMDI